MVYCNDIDQLLKRVEEIRGKLLQLNRYGIDHGQDWLKVVLSLIHGPQYVDSVEGALLVAVANCIETPFNIQQIIGLQDVTLSHHTNKFPKCASNGLCCKVNMRRNYTGDVEMFAAALLMWTDIWIFSSDIGNKLMIFSGRGSKLIDALEYPPAKDAGFGIRGVVYDSKNVST